MEIYEVTEIFSSLSQETRLKVFKLLVEYGCEGAVPGALVKELKIPDNTLSFHLSHMTKVGLLQSQKKGRSITYFANPQLIEELIDFLGKNCCARGSKKRSNERRC